MRKKIKISIILLVLLFSGVFVQADTCCANPNQPANIFCSSSNPVSQDVCCPSSGYASTIGPSNQQQCQNSYYSASQGCLAYSQCEPGCCCTSTPFQGTAANCPSPPTGTFQPGAICSQSCQTPPPGGGGGGSGTPGSGGGGGGVGTCTDADGDGFGTTASTACRKSGIDCDDTPGSGAAINPDAVDNCNTPADEDCSGAPAECPPASCKGEPFSITKDKATCDGQTGCFYDKSQTTVNDCYACNQLMTCYDYKSSGSCGTDACSVGQCEWRNTYAEGGYGVCVSKVNNLCLWCPKKGTTQPDPTVDPNSQNYIVQTYQAHNDIYDACTDARKNAMTTALFNCGAITGGACPMQGATKQCGSTNKGKCRYGVSTCGTDLQWGACVDNVEPDATETCGDQIDNDCDDSRDEGCACSPNDATKVCGSNTGECDYGTQTCTGGTWGTCTGGVNPATEACDNKDNNCDNVIDEGCACTSGQSRTCGSTIGECRQGTQKCTNSQWESTCLGGVNPLTEICSDSKDNNCDTSTDEGCQCTPANSQKDCGIDRGICTAGKQTCSSQGLWGLCSGNGPRAEICGNNIDEDCSGADLPCGSNPCTPDWHCDPPNMWSACVNNQHTCSGDLTDRSSCVGATPPSRTQSCTTTPVVGSCAQIDVLPPVNPVGGSSVTFDAKSTFNYANPVLAMGGGGRVDDGSPTLFTPQGGGYGWRWQTTVATVTSASTYTATATAIKDGASCNGVESYTIIPASGTCSASNCAACAATSCPSGCNRCGTVCQSATCPPCNPDWHCDVWNPDPCSPGQTQTCTRWTDRNSCGGTHSGSDTQPCGTTPPAGCTAIDLNVPSNPVAGSDVTFTASSAYNYNENGASNPSLALGTGGGVITSGPVRASSGTNTVWTWQATVGSTPSSSYTAIFTGTKSGQSCTQSRNYNVIASTQSCGTSSCGSCSTQSACSGASGCSWCSGACISGSCTSCTPDWHCNQWSDCVNNQKTCVGGWTDNNHCGGQQPSNGPVSCQSNPGPGTGCVTVNVDAPQNNIAGSAVTFAATSTHNYGSNPLLSLASGGRIDSSATPFTPQGGGYGWRWQSTVTSVPGSYVAAFTGLKDSQTCTGTSGFNVLTNPATCASGQGCAACSSQSACQGQGCNWCAGNICQSQSCPIICTPDWHCNSWSPDPCSPGQTQTCSGWTDRNNCPGAVQPSLNTRPCSDPPGPGAGCVLVNIDVPSNPAAGSSVTFDATSAYNYGSNPLLSLGNGGMVSSPTTFVPSPGTFGWRWQSTVSSIPGSYTALFTGIKDGQTCNGARGYNVVSNPNPCGSGQSCGGCGSQTACQGQGCNWCSGNVCRSTSCTTPPGSCPDVDGDGYGAAGTTGCQNIGIDCNDNNANIKPGAADICANSIDEDCSGGDAAPDWHCNQWSDCINNQKTCVGGWVDRNNCPGSPGQPGNGPVSCQSNPGPGTGCVLINVDAPQNNVGGSSVSFDASSTYDYGNNPLLTLTGGLPTTQNPAKTTAGGIFRWRWQATVTTTPGNYVATASGTKDGQQCTGTSGYNVLSAPGSCSVSNCNACTTQLTCATGCNWCSGNICQLQACSGGGGGGGGTCPDLDGDGYGAAGTTGCRNSGTDCDDRPGVGAISYPGATETCDGYDNNCDEIIDNSQNGCPLRILLTKPRNGATNVTPFDVEITTDKTSVCRYKQFASDFDSMFGFPANINNKTFTQANYVITTSPELFYVKCKDSTNRGAISPAQSFELTYDTTHPIIIEAKATPPVVADYPLLTRLSATTNEKAFCKFGTGKEYDDLQRKFSRFNEDNVSEYSTYNTVDLADLADNTIYSYNVSCKNLVGLTSNTAQISFIVNTSVAPELTIISPANGMKTRNNSITLNALTNKKAICSYGNTTEPSDRSGSFGAEVVSHESNPVQFNHGTHKINIKCSFATMQGVFIRTASTTFTVDLTPPEKPSVDDTSTYSNPQKTPRKDILSARFKSSDAESDIAFFNYTIFYTNAGVEEYIINWTKSTEERVNVRNLNLSEGTTYYFLAKAINEVGAQSAENESDGIAVDSTAAPSTCANNRTDIGETDKDCGGLCPGCLEGGKCNNTQDCFGNLYCNASRQCSYPTCLDGVKNQDESDIDCGGDVCSPCIENKECTVGTDCLSGECGLNGQCTSAGTCANGKKDDDESDVDCGLKCADNYNKKCDGGKQCKSNLDCKAGKCNFGLCGFIGDKDNDNASDSTDNCPEIYNPKQEDTDKDKKGDACDEDADADGMLDECEKIAFNTIECKDEATCGPNADPDQDGLTNLEECASLPFTDPLKKDTDGDGYSDKDELDAGTDPLDKDSHPSGFSFLKLFLWLILILLLIGGGVAGYLYYKKKKEEKEQNLHPFVPPIISRPKPIGPMVQKPVPKMPIKQQILLKKKRNEEELKERSKLFDAFDVKKNETENKNESELGKEKESTGKEEKVDLPKPEHPDIPLITPPTEQPLYPEHADVYKKLAELTRKKPEKPFKELKKKKKS